MIQVNASTISFDYFHSCTTARNMLPLEATARARALNMGMAQALKEAWRLWGAMGGSEKGQGSGP